MLCFSGWKLLVLKFVVCVCLQVLGEILVGFFFFCCCVLRAILIELGFGQNFVAWRGSVTGCFEAWGGSMKSCCFEAWRRNVTVFTLDIIGPNLTIIKIKTK